MKFGKEFRIHLEETLPEWKDKYLCYKLLKNLLKNVPIASTGDSVPTVSPAPPHVLPTDRRPPTLDAVDSLIAHPRDYGAGLQDWFIKILIQELHKFNDFYVDKEEEFVIRFQELKERIERVKEKSHVDGILTSESEFSDEMMEIRKDFVTIHGEMVLLKNYSSLNFAGLIKILKKYDKRTGELLCLPFTHLAFNQPFFTTEPLTRLVHECEENLELLFPLVAEVFESSSTTHDQMNEKPSDITNVSSEASLSLGEETVVYRSTVAAIRTIQGLKKASSTYNPFSFASLFECHDNDSSGSVTAENSPSSSLGPLQNLESKNDAQSK